MFAVDTNILIYGHFEQYPQHQTARRFCEDELLGGQSGDWALGWQVVYEYLRLVTHPRVHQRPLSLSEAWTDLAPYLQHRRCHILTATPQHPVILAHMLEAYPSARGNLAHDLHYATLLQEHRVRTLYTADHDFRRFEFLKVVDPSTTESAARQQRTAET